MKTIIYGLLLTTLLGLLSADASNGILKTVGWIVTGLFFLSLIAMAVKVSRGAE
jgi:preprotein translocase subunit SecG